MPVTIDKEDCDVWLPRQLADREPGTAMVVMHSVMWQYLTDADRATCTTAIETAGAAATPETPARVAPPRAPPRDASSPASCASAPGTAPSDREVLLANTGFHGGPLTWAPPPSAS